MQHTGRTHLGISLTCVMSRLAFITLYFCGVLGLCGGTGVAQAATYYWTGAAGASNNVATNWSTTVNAACGVSTGGAVPGSSDSVIFDTTCKNSAAINNPWSIASMDMQSGYTGTITLSSNVSI